MARSGDYQSASKPHRERGKQIRSLIKQMLSDEGIAVHSVTHRVKTEGSASAKIDASPNRYGSFGDLHDLLGVRVITHLATEVDAVVAVLRKEFDVDGKRSVDKIADLNADEFGYRSYHLIVKLKEDRAALAEWRIFAGIHFEIQVRSILQHAWAEIEHDLGYKSSVDVPQEIHRRFARLAGILELADDEFVRLTKDAKTHARKTDAAVKRGVNVPVDRDSIRSLVTSANSVRSADAYISDQLGWTLLTEPPSEYANLRAKELREVGLETIADVNREMSRHGERVARFATAWFEYNVPSRHDDDEFMFMGRDEADDDDSDDERTITPGVSLFYLYLHLALEREGDEFDSVPADPNDDFDEEHYEANDLRRLAFRRIHDGIFSGGGRTSA
ncbi:GTP pyrophosphokinase family protein [Microbacterium sp. ZW CA_36]|uniref:GTP pyrophosphokinase n=1 Tax=Microbacterium sp. ZW CA_36 TaxID=3378078 RepID=UPI0038543001